LLLLSFNLVLFLEHILGSVFQGAGIIAGRAIARLATISALFIRNYLLNSSRQKRIDKMRKTYLLIRLTINKTDKKEFCQTLDIRIEDGELINAVGHDSTVKLVSTLCGTQLQKTELRLR